jgi:23S rRNA-/tRNA-specific pseudouridylate synthase
MGDPFRGRLHPRVYVVCSDANQITALYKPCGLLSMPNEEEIIVKNALLRVPYDRKGRCYVFPDNRKFFLLNRLDAPTSGLLIGCFDETIAKVIRQCFARQEVRKTYYALTAYQKIPPIGAFHDALEERLEGAHLRVFRGQGNRATTEYCVQKELRLGEISLLKLRLQPLTGRTHQLRVQCALRKLPIVGDKTYGDFAFNKKLWPLLPEKRLYLQSCAIEFSYGVGEKVFSFSSKISCEF